MKNIKKILIIIQRSNGDVFLSHTLVKTLYDYFKNVQIDLLVNDDTLEVARLLPCVSFIHTFSYQKKQNSRFKQEKNLIFSLFRKYDLSINLTASDRSVIYALLAGKKSISAVEKEQKKSWWKKNLLTYYYYFDPNKHILTNNLQALNILKISHKKIIPSITFSKSITVKVKERLNFNGIEQFIIFHPSAQYNYKVYPKHLRDQLLHLLNDLALPIIITGGSSDIDFRIKNEIPALPNIYNLIGETSLEEFFILSQLSLAYVGMDTLNMHIASSQNKSIFAIFGPTNLRMWSPWSNQDRMSATQNKLIQTYGNVTIFQASLPCVACGKAGCDDNHGKSNCLYAISPVIVFNEIKEWYSQSI